MKITRRNLAAAALASAGLKARSMQAPASTPPEEPNAAAKEVHKNSETLAKFDLPMSTEPAFQFKP
jgi:hypothetical protein